MLLFLSTLQVTIHSSPEQPSRPSQVINNIGRRWGRIERREVTEGIAEVMTRSFSNHASTAYADDWYRCVCVAAVRVLLLTA